MTTDAGRRPAFPFGGIAAALLVWFGGMAVLALVSDPSAVIVIGPDAQTTAEMIGRADGALLTSRGPFATGTSDRAGFVKRLYAAGAWFVWPALTRGCFKLGRFTR